MLTQRKFILFLENGRRHYADLGDGSNEPIESRLQNKRQSISDRTRWHIL